MNANKFTLLVILGLTSLAIPLTAAPIETALDDGDVIATEEDESEPTWTPSVYIGLRYLSKQISYGIIDNPHGILLPNLELSYENEDLFTLTVGAEAYIDMTNYGAKEGEYSNRRHKAQELDLYLKLAKTWDTQDLIGSSLETSLTYLYEYHPKRMRKVAASWYNSTQWLYAEFAATDYYLIPKLTLEYNLDDNQETQGSLYATFDLSHKFDLSSFVNKEEGFLTLTPKVGIGAANKERNMGDFENTSRFMLRDAYATVDLNISPFEGFSITPTIGCHQQIDADARAYTEDNQFVAYFGIGISYEY